MDQPQQPRRRTIGRWVLWALLCLAFVYILYGGYRYGWKWTGMVKDPDFRERTLWEWLGLLIVPAVLALGGYLFTRSENRRTQDIAERQRALDQKLAEQRTNEARKIADERRQDDLLQAYLDQMGSLLLEEDLRNSEENSEARTLAWAWTSTVLSRLNGVRKGSVVRFLYEAGLIARDRRVLDLSGADLNGANLSRAALSGVILSGAP